MHGMFSCVCIREKKRIKPRNQRHACSGYVRIFGRYLRAEEVGRLKLLVEKNQPFGWKHSPSIKKWDSILFRQIFWPDKWDLREKYGGPNLGDKDF